MRAFDLTDLAHSQFEHYETTPKETMEDWARAFNQVAADLEDATEAGEGPDRTKITGIAARWYLSQPLTFRDTDGSKCANSSGSGCG